MSHSQRVALIIINQTTNPAFNDWLNALVVEPGSLEFWTGNPPTDLDSRIHVRTAAAYNRTSNQWRLLTWLQFTFTVAFRLLWVNHRIPILVVTNPPFLPLLVSLIHALFRTPYGLIEWDIYPQIAAVMNLLRPNGFMYYVWYRWHQHTLRYARVIWTLGDNMADELCSMLPNVTLPVSVVPNWVDTNALRPIPYTENTFAQERHLADKLVVLYSGNLGATHSIETILTVAAKLRDDPRIQFIIAGDGMKRQIIERANLPNLTLLPLQSHEDFLKLLASAVIGIVTVANGYERFSVPSKIYGMLAAGNAILGISTAPNDLAATIQRHQCGVNFAEDAVDRIVLWLQEMVDTPEKLQEYQRNARDAAERFYSAAVCIPRLNQIIRETLLNDKT